MVSLPAIGPASIVEVIFTLAAAIGMGFSLFSFLEARADARALDKAKIKNGRRKLATLASRDEGTRFLMQGLFVIVGLAAAIRPGATEIDIPSLVTQVLLVGSAGLLAWASGMSVRDRRELMRKDVV